ncbi:MAG: hypothetical protein RJA49_2766 [Actinomycetota bacterium]
MTKARRIAPDPDLWSTETIERLRRAHHGLGLAPYRAELLRADLPTALVALEAAMTPSGGGSSQGTRNRNGVPRPTEGAVMARLGSGWPRPDAGQAPRPGPVPQADAILAAIEAGLAHLARASKLVAEVTRKASVEEAALVARQHRCQPTAGEAGALTWYSPCADLASKDGLCAAHYMRRWRWRQRAA